jgi:hypothetical protein
VYGELRNPKTLHVLWNGKKVGVFEHKHPPGENWNNLTWSRRTVAVTGKGADRITFLSTTAATINAGPMIDDVTISPGRPASATAAADSVRSIRCVTKAANGAFEPAAELLYDKNFYVEVEYESELEQNARIVTVQTYRGPLSKSVTVKVMRLEENPRIYRSGAILLAPQRRLPKKPGTTR